MIEAIIIEAFKVILCMGVGWVLGVALGVSWMQKKYPETRPE